MSIPNSVIPSNTMVGMPKDMSLGNNVDVASLEALAQLLAPEFQTTDDVWRFFDGFNPDPAPHPLPQMMH